MILYVAAAGAGLAALLLLLLWGRLPGGRQGRKAANRGETPPPGARTCPLCGSRLTAGETVRSDMTQGPGDRVMRIYGCPHCWEAPLRRAVAGGPVRICPYCLGEIPEAGWAVARYFERPGRRHVHVLGCTRCRPGA